MPKSARKWILLAFAVQELWLLPVGAFFLHRWLATDEPDGSYPCRDSDGRMSTCYEGQTDSMILGLVFTLIGVVILAVIAYLATRWARLNRREAYIRQHGLTTRVVITGVAPTNVRVNDQQMYRLTGHAPDNPAVALRHSTLTPVPPGTYLTVAYDPADPSDPVVLDDLRALSRSMRLNVMTPLNPGAARIHHLSQLDALRASGAISAEEFERLKAEVLDGP